MSIHHHIKPHHHYAIWMLSLLAVLAMVAAYNTLSVEKLQAQTEPSEQTKKFFGFEGEEAKSQEWVQPEECKMQEQQDQMQKLSQQMQATSGEMATLQQKDPASLTEEDKAKIAELQSKMTSLQAQIDELQKKFQTGPSDECKKAIVAQAVSQMEQMQSKMETKFFGTLKKVDDTVAKVEGMIPGLQAAGVEKETIDKIKAHLSTIKASVTTLRTFFSKMQSAMDNWLAAAKADPIKAFNDMQAGKGFMSESGASTAAKAADDMVAALEDLVAILDKLAQKESNGNTQ